MSELVISTFVEELKNAWAEDVSDPDLLQLLYDAVAYPLNLFNKNKDAIIVDKSTCSKIMNRKKNGNVIKIIRHGASDTKVINSIENYFDKNVLNRLHKACIYDLIENMKNIIENDSLISEEKKKELLECANSNCVSKFLGHTYLYSLTRDNVLNDEKKNMCDFKTCNGYNIENISVPDNIINEERRYAEALLEIYGQTEHIEHFDIEMLNSYPKHQKHFSEQRGYYFSAEAVRRGTRDIYNNEDQFEVLKEETYEGIKDTWEEEYKNGYTRLRRVMTQASNTRVDKCWLSKDTDWIGNTQKKGVCHFLVKEGRIDGWVREDDEESI